MVDGISRLNATQGVTGTPDGVRNQDAYGGCSTQTFNYALDNSGKGTSVQRSGSNPFYTKADFERYDGLGNNRMAIADTETKRVQAELARLYNDVKRLNPEAVENLEFPPLPDVPPKGKKDVRLSSYLSALNEYRETCEELLEGVGKATVVDEVNANTDRRARETQGMIVASTTAELAAIYGLQENMFNGFSHIHNLIETDTHKIISAVNTNGQKVIRAINKATGEIEEHITQDGNVTRIQEFLNTQGLQDNINYTRTQLGYKIDDQGAWTRGIVRSEASRTRKHVTSQGDETREVIRSEGEQTRDVIDPFGMFH